LIGLRQTGYPNENPFRGHPFLGSHPVTKARARYHVRGCVAELTEVIADANAIRTAAIEDADPEKVIEAVRAMEMDGFPNVSYPRGLKQLVGMSR
jgi:hypothetical protein